MSINFDQIVKIMISSAKNSFKTHWPVIKDYAESEFEKLGKTIINIEYLLLSGKISIGEASVILEIQKNTARAIMLTLQGMSLLMVEQAINEALDAIKGIVNGALGSVLL